MYIVDSLLLLRLVYWNHIQFSDVKKILGDVQWSAAQQFAVIDEKGVTITRAHMWDGLSRKFWPLQHLNRNKVHYHLSIIRSRGAQRSFFQSGDPLQKKETKSTQEDRFHSVEWREKVKDEAQLFQFSKKGRHHSTSGPSARRLSSSVASSLRSDGNVSFRTHKRVFCVLVGFVRYF